MTLAGKMHVVKHQRIDEQMAWVAKKRKRTAAADGIADVVLEQ
jgi:hypothetical protein